MGKKAFWPKMTTLGLAVSVLLMSVTPSLGQESLQPNTSAKEKSPNTAFWWSLVGTVVPVAALAGDRRDGCRTYPRAASGPVGPHSP